MHPTSYPAPEGMTRRVDTNMQFESLTPFSRRDPELGAVQPAEGSRVGTLLDALPVRTRDPSLRLKNACGQDDAIRDGQDPALNAPLGTSPILGNLRES